ncbi:uncharacterized protein FIBRA_07877 [Fibroporia radiculosa]|uniref:Protein FAF1 n=1 Tax=Fibroporia radiculosa TaxID=599839 RepID=J4I1K2_9APHY|nr:uncharacterized protein FIBRA_07877 [Fibroporia radiculosa]CCM05647.1 predicted protein [Fibroporia radiculosa]
MTSKNQQDLLQALEAHGQQFLSSFSSPVVLGKRKNTGDTSSRKTKKEKMQEVYMEEEWSGIRYSDEDQSEDEDEDLVESGFSDVLSDVPGEVHRSVKTNPSNVVVFSDEHSRSAPPAPKMTKAQMKAFMSSKVTRLTQDVQDQSSGDEPENEDEEKTNAQNDALLHRLVHTRILSGSLNPDLDLTPAQRKKALAGRVLEAAGKAKLGKGEGIVRAAERNKAAKRVREGMVTKQIERSQKELEEAKQLGNYHPTLKKLYDASSQTHSKRKRTKGLGMGVGTFKGGVLKLSKADISLMQDSGSRKHQGFNKRGGKRR